jgi:hypothetical protein
MAAYRRLRQEMGRRRPIGGHSLLRLDGQITGFHSFTHQLIDHGLVKTANKNQLSITFDFHEATTVFIRGHNYLERKLHVGYVATMEAYVSRCEGWDGNEEVNGRRHRIVDRGRAYRWV